MNSEQSYDLYRNRLLPACGVCALWISEEELVVGAYKNAILSSLLVDQFLAQLANGARPFGARRIIDSGLEGQDTDHRRLSVLATKAWRLAISVILYHLSIRMGSEQCSRRLAAEDRAQGGLRGRRTR